MHLSIRSAAWYVLTILAACSVLSSRCRAQTSGVVTATTLNIRAEATTKAAIVTKLKSGDRVEVVQESGEWIRIKAADGKTGWSLKKYFAFDSAPPVETQKSRLPSDTRPREDSPPPERAQMSETSRTRMTPMSEASLSAGILAGGAMSQLAGSSVTGDFGPRMGITAGAFLHFRLDDMFAVQPRLQYVMKGATHTVGGAETTLQFDYIELPVLLRISFAVSPMVRPYVSAGPTIAYNLQAIVTSSGQGAATQEITDTKKFDYGITAGGGVQLLLGSQRVFLDAHYALGLAGLHDAQSDPLDIKHRTITVTAGWFIL